MITIKDGYSEITLTDGEFQLIIQAVNQMAEFWRDIELPAKNHKLKEEQLASWSKLLNKIECF